LFITVWLQFKDEIMIHAGVLMLHLLYTEFRTGHFYVNFRLRIVSETCFVVFWSYCREHSVQGKNRHEAGWT